MTQKEILKQKLVDSKKQLTTYLATLSEEQWDVEVYSENNHWTVKDIVAHLVEAETGLSIQVYKIRKDRESVPEGFDLDRWNAGTKERMGHLTPAELLAKYDEARLQTLEKLETVEPHEWAKQGRHPSFEGLTVAQYYEIIANHVINHLADIQRVLEK